MDDNWTYVIEAKFKMENNFSRSKIIMGISKNIKDNFGDFLNIDEMLKKKRLRINIMNNPGKKVGQINLFTELNQVEAAVLAATLETVERIESKKIEIDILKIKDLKVELREIVVNRAKEILSSSFMDSSPTKSELRKMVLQSN